MKKMHFFVGTPYFVVFALKTYDLHGKYLHCDRAGYVGEDGRNIFILNARTQENGT
jgi:hypothetical protein